MLILLSPAKRLDFDTNWNSFITTQPQFREEASILVDKLNSHKIPWLRKTLQVSKPLAELNYDRFQKWVKDHNSKKSKPAVLAYQGDVFQQFNDAEYSKDQQEYLQNSLRIITGLYGLLRPYDLIQPYRLEMKIKLKIKSKKNLYEYWRNILTKTIEDEVMSKDHKFIVNLASDEYSKAIDLKEISVPVYTIKFQQQTPKGLKSIMLPVKHARGKMMAYLIANQVSDIESLKKFNSDGYKFDSQDNAVLTFIKSN